MRILLSCLQSVQRHPLPSYRFWERYFKEGCSEAGIEFVDVPGVDWAEGLVRQAGGELAGWRSRTWDLVLKFARQEQVAGRPIDCFLGYLFPRQVDVSAINELQRIGIPCVNFFCDNAREFHRLPDEFQPFALHWVADFEGVTLYRNAGLAHVHAPMPCWVPPKFRSLPPVETEPPTFIGAADILRRDLLGRALQAGADIVLYGAGWVTEHDLVARPPERARSFRQILSNQMALTRTHGFRGLYHKIESRWRPLRPPEIDPERTRPMLSDDEYFRVSREATVTIGVNRMPTTRTSNWKPLLFSRLRDLEAPMLGACYLTEWTDGLAQLYDLDADIETYKTADELVEKLQALSRDPAKRLELRRRAQTRALNELTASKSIQKVLKVLSS